MNGGIEFKGLDEFTAQLQTLRKKYPDEAEKELRKLGLMLKKKAISKTPPIGGETRKDKYALKKCYHLSATKQGGSTIFVEFNSSSPHFHLVERGHRNVGKDGKEHGFTPGVHMVENSMNEMDKEVPEELSNWMGKMITRYGL
jgi:HK97 gp10 family phage protein